MTTTLTRRVVPLIGVLALLLTLLVPQTNAAFATETSEDGDDTQEAEDEGTEEAADGGTEESDDGGTEESDDGGTEESDDGTEDDGTGDASGENEVTEGDGTEESRESVSSTLDATNGEEIESASPQAGGKHPEPDPTWGVEVVDQNTSNGACTTYDGGHRADNGGNHTSQAFDVVQDASRGIITVDPATGTKITLVQVKAGNGYHEYSLANAPDGHDLRGSFQGPRADSVSNWVVCFDLDDVPPPADDCVPVDELFRNNSGTNRNAFDITWTATVDGSHYSVEVSLADEDAILCEDATIFFSSYTMPDDWNGSGFNSTAVPQDWFDTGDTLVFEAGESGQTQTSTVKVPDVCRNAQIDLYWPKVDGNGDPVDEWGGFGGPGFELGSNGHGSYYIDHRFQNRDSSDCERDPNATLTTMCWFDDDGNDVKLIRFRNDGDYPIGNLGLASNSHGPLIDGDLEDPGFVLQPGETTFFTVSRSQPGTVIVEWDDYLDPSTGLITKAGSETKAQGDEPCHFEVTPTKTWSSDDPGIDFKITIESSNGTSGSLERTEGTVSTDGIPVKVPFGGTYTVTEEVTGWTADPETVGQFDVPEGPTTAAEWSEYFDGGKQLTHEVVNVPNDVELNFQKIVCDDYTGIRGNTMQATSPDDTDGNFAFWASNNPPNPITPINELPDGCEFASGWTFSGVVQAGTPGSATDFPYNTEATGSDGIVTVQASELIEDEDDLKHFLAGRKLWISEDLQEGSEFGALQCYSDALHADNLEFIQVRSGELPESVWCVAWNVEPVEVQFGKVICPDHTTIPRNPNNGTNTGLGGVDLTLGGIDDMPGSLPGGWVNAQDEFDAAIEEGCAAGTWEFNLVDASENPVELSNGDTSVTVTGIDTVTLTGDALALARDNKLWVRESFTNLVVPADLNDGAATQQDGDYIFGALRCTNDAANNDNREQFNLGSAGAEDPLGCIAYNVPAGEIEVTKDVVGNPGESSFEICIIPVDRPWYGEEILGTAEVGDIRVPEIIDVPWFDCATFDSEGGSHTFGPLLPGDYLVVETEDGDADSVSYAGGTPVVEGDGVIVDTRDEDTSVTVTNTFRNGNGGGTSSTPVSLELSAEAVCIDPQTNAHEILVSSEATGLGTTGTLTLGADDPGITIDLNASDVPVAWPLDDGLLVESVELTLTAGSQTDTATVTLLEDCLEIGGELEELPEEEPEQEPTDDPTETPEESDESTDDEEETVTQVTDDTVEVLGVTITSEQLPRTGASTMLLIVLGLLGVGLGAMLLRRRDTAEDAS
jgi:LPXTG-motif cell wall-anchored protein